MLRFLYRYLLKPILFRMNPEFVHNVFVSFGQLIGRFRLGRWWIAAMYKYRGPYKGKTVDGIHYPCPVVLAAGFDYNGRLANILDCMSFGGVEIGSVTARPCEGNEKPRLRRMVKSKALVVYKGLKNEGVDAVIKRLKRTKRREGFVWGVSIAKTNDALSATTEAGIADYAHSLKRLHEDDIGDFYTINISCPNVHGGESFAHPKHLRPLFDALSAVDVTKPVYVKMPINEDWSDFNALLEVLDTYEMVKGVIIGNLNKNYKEADFPEEAPETYRGGLSGKACRSRSTALIKRTREHWHNRFTIIGCGGVLSADDAMEKLDVGVDLIQLISGMIFEGPHLMKDICKRMETRG